MVRPGIRDFYIKKYYRIGKFPPVWDDLKSKIETKDHVFEEISIWNIFNFYKKKTFMEPKKLQHLQKIHPGRTIWIFLVSRRWELNPVLEFDILHENIIYNSWDVISGIPRLPLHHPAPQGKILQFCDQLMWFPLWKIVFVRLET